MCLNDRVPYGCQYFNDMIYTGMVNERCNNQFRKVTQICLFSMTQSHINIKLSKWISINKSVHIALFVFISLHIQHPTTPHWPIWILPVTWLKFNIQFLTFLFVHSPFLYIQKKMWILKDPASHVIEISKTLPLPNIISTCH